MVRFSECFWDSEFNGTVGYDCLIKRLKEGKKICDDFTEFVRLRAKAEDEYGKALIKIAQNAGGNEEIGTMRAAWDVMRRETESIGNAHCSASQKLSEEIEKNARDFREKQKIERLKIDEKMKRLQKEKKNCYENVMKCKRLYEQKCKESDAAREALDSKSLLTYKEEERLRSRTAKAKTAAEASDTGYQYSVTALEEIRQRWEKNTEMSYNQFQTLEEERIKFLRNAVWIYSNIGSLTTVNVDAACEKMRKTLEKCDEVVDIQQFIMTKQTGFDRPAPILYENFYNSVHDSVSDSRPTLAMANANHDYPRRLHDEPPPLPSTAMKGHGKTPAPGTGYASANFIAYTREDKHDSDYSSIQELRPDSGSHVPEMPKRVRAAFDYNAQGDQELTLRRGDIIQILDYEDEIWAYGSLGNGAKGVFPMSFVESA